MRIEIDLDRLRTDIRTMTRKSLLFKALKQELSELGYWQNRPRGNPKEGYKKMKETKCLE